MTISMFSLHSLSGVGQIIQVLFEVYSVVYRFIMIIIIIIIIIRFNKVRLPFLRQYNQTQFAGCKCSLSKGPKQMCFVTGFKISKKL